MMSELDNLLISVSNTISTYRVDELPAPSPEHVHKWLQQFNEENHLPFLREFDHVLKEGFITKNNIEQFLSGLAKNKKLSGDDPAAFWAKANFLKIQKNGQSQKEMLILFNDCLLSSYGLALNKCGSEGGDYIYIDDVLFTGGRIGSDLERWIYENAPSSANVQVIVAVCHTGGQYLLERRLKEAIIKSGKKINIKYWFSMEIESRKFNRNNSNILWPISIPETIELKRFMELPSKYPFEPRVQLAKHVDPFSSEQGRQLLEREFLIAGAKIISEIDNLKSNIRPLGLSPFGLGFGATIITYRNCPNNCPLAIWWGDPNATSGALKWYPLLPREGYSSPKNVFQDLTDVEL